VCPDERASDLGSFSFGAFSEQSICHGRIGGFGVLKLQCSTSLIAAHEQLTFVDVSF
jgi:hypothetical protein